MTSTMSHKSLRTLYGFGHGFFMFAPKSRMWSEAARTCEMSPSCPFTVLPDTFFWNWMARLHLVGEKYAK